MVDQINDAVAAVVVKRERDARALVAFTGIDHAAAGVDDVKIAGGVVGVDRAIALIARAFDRARIDDAQALAVDVHAATVRGDRACVEETAAGVIALAKVDAVVGAGDLAAPRVDDITLHAHAIYEAKASRWADRAFGRDAASVHDIRRERCRLETAVCGTRSLKTNAIPGGHVCGGGLAATNNGALVQKGGRGVRSLSG